MNQVIEHSAGTQGQANAARAQGRRVHRLPIQPLQGRNGDTYRTIHVAKFANGGIDIRVDWNGSQEHFQVKDLDDAWLPIDNIEVGPNNSVIKAGEDRPSGAFLARFQRGPWAPLRPFRVQVVGIEWKHQSQAEFARWLSDSSFTAVRHTHYACLTDPDTTTFHESDDYEGKQWVSVEMEAGRDYEITVELWHPTTEAIHIIDPIVRGGDGEPF